MADFADFRARYPELVACGDGNEDAITAFLEEYATLYGYPGRCPKYADLLQMAYAAHMVSRSSHNPDGTPDTTPGPIQSESVGGVSFSYATGQGGRHASFWGSTPYGTEFARLQSMCVGSGVMVAP